MEGNTEIRWERWTGTCEMQAPVRLPCSWRYSLKLTVDNQGDVGAHELIVQPARVKQSASRALSVTDLSGLGGKPGTSQGSGQEQSEK